MLKNWFLATRPKTLVACLIPILCATFLAFGTVPTTHFTWSISLFALLSTLCIQIGTNLVNDAVDFRKGADTIERLGPTRVSQSGLIPHKTVMQAGLLFFFLATLFGIPLVLTGGMTIFWIGIFSILCGYFYTAGPYPIAYHGFGEIFVLLFFGFIAVCGTYFLHTGHVNTQSVILSVQIGTMTCVILAVNNYRDFITDRKVNKLTLPARFGKIFARYEILFLYVVAYTLNFYWYFEYGFMIFLFGMLTLPVAFKVTQGIFKTEPSKYINKYLGMSALVELLFGILISFGFVYFT